MGKTVTAEFENFPSTDLASYWDVVGGQAFTDSPAHNGVKSLTLQATPGSPIVWTRSNFEPPNPFVIAGCYAQTSAVDKVISATHLVEFFSYEWDENAGDWTMLGTWASPVTDLPTNAWVLLEASGNYPASTEFARHRVLIQSSTGTWNYEKAFLDSFYIDTGTSIPVRKRQLSSREFTPRRGPQATR